MAVSALSAGKTLCELRDWSLSNLELQKVLYLAHMFSLGDKATPLIEDDFEAWDYGPVVPGLYRKAKGFGSSAVRNVFHWIESVPEGSREYELLKEVADATKKLTAGKFVAITHWDEGAWAKHYKPGALGIVIPNADIREEYLERLRRQREKAG